MLPRDIPGKGQAVREVLEKLPAGTFPIYVGDDASDESAFAALPHGLTIRVGMICFTRAMYRLRNPAEVRLFLEKLEAEIR